LKLRIADCGLRIEAAGLVVLDDLALQFRNPQSQIRNRAGVRR